MSEIAILTLVAFTYLKPISCAWIGMQVFSDILFNTSGHLFDNDLQIDLDYLDDIFNIFFFF